MKEENIFLSLSGKLTRNANYVCWQKNCAYDNIKPEVWQSNFQKLLLLLIIKQMTQTSSSIKNSKHFQGKYICGSVHCLQSVFH